MQFSAKNVAVAVAVLLIAFAAFKAYQPAKPGIVNSHKPDQMQAQPVQETTDINSASLEALTKIPGIDDEMAKKIIAGRPYGSKMWLVSDNVIPENVFQEIRNQLAANQTPETIEILRKRAESAGQAQ